MQTTSKVFEQIIGSLKENNITYQLFEHEPVYTSADAAKIRQTKETQGAKALVFFADKKPILLVLPGNRKADTKTFKKTFNIRDLSFAKPEQVFDLTSLEIGAVPPFGNLMNLPTYVDKTLLLEEEIAFNAGAHTKSIKMKTQDFLKLCKPIINIFSKD